MRTAWQRLLAGLRAPQAVVRRLSLAAAAGFLLSSVAPASAQNGRVFIDVNGGTQATSTDFVDNVLFTEFVEEGDFDATYAIDSGVIVDVSGGVALSRGLAIGVGYSRFNRTNDAGVDARIPHPFFFNRDRTVAGSLAGLTHEETAVHVQLRWFAPLGDRVSLALFGGPTFFKLSQDLVTTVGFSQSYPFDVATFTSAASGRDSASAVGYNVGADVSVFFSRHVGVGVLARFTRGTVDLVSQDEGLVSIDTGGFHAGGGLRLRF